MDMIKVLLCDDDNHDYVVAFEDGRFYYNVRGLLAELSAPHDNSYDIRIVHLVELDEDAVRVGPFVMSTDEWFDVVACNAVPLKYHDQKEFCKRAAFDVMWERSEAYA